MNSIEIYHFTDQTGTASDTRFTLLPNTPKTEHRFVT